MSEQPPIEEVLDNIVPDWREIAHKMKNEGHSDLEIVTELRSIMSKEMDAMLDLYNDLGEDK